MRQKLIFFGILLFALYLTFFYSSSQGPSFESRKALEDGILNLQSRNFPRAEELFYQAIVSSPEWDEPYIYYALTSNYLGKYPQAIQAYEKAHTLNPANFKVLEGLVSTYLLQELPKQAETYLQKMKDLAPTSLITARYEGTLLCLQKKYQEAVPHLEKSLAAPDNRLAYYKLVECFQHLQQEDKKIQIYQQALKQHPDEVSLFRNYLSSMQDLGKETQVIDELRTLLKSENQESHPYYKMYLGQVLLQKTQTEAEGQSLLEEMSKNKNFALESVQILARYTINHGQFEAAEKYLQQGLESYPFHPNLQKFLGDVYRFQQKNENALETYQNWAVRMENIPIEKKIPVILSELYVLIDLKKWENALQLLEKTEKDLETKKQQGSPLAQENLWKLAYEKALLPRYQNRITETRETLQQLLTRENLPPLFASSFEMELAFTFWAEGFYEKAIEHFQNVRKKHAEKVDAVLLCLIFEGILTQQQTLFQQAQALVQEKKLPLDAFTLASIEYLSGQMTEDAYEQVPRTFLQKNDYAFFRAIRATTPESKTQWLTQATQFFSQTDFPSFLAQALLHPTPK